MRTSPITGAHSKRREEITHNQQIKQFTNKERITSGASCVLTIIAHIKKYTVDFKLCYAEYCREIHKKNITSYDRKLHISLVWLYCVKNQFLIVPSSPIVLFLQRFFL